VTGSLGHVLTDPFGDAFMRRAMVEVLLLGAAGGALACWVTLYNLSYSAESLAHGMLPGLVLAALIGAPLLLGAAVGVLLASGAIAMAARITGIERDTAVAIVVTTLFGAGVVLALAPATPAGLGRLLFGDPLGATDSDLAVAGAVVLAIGAVLPILHHRLLIVGFDRASATGLGVRAEPVDLALLALIAITLLVAVQGLGNLLVVAVLVAPAAAARRLTRRIGPMMATSATIAAVAGVTGLYVSYYADIAAGAAIALSLLAAVTVSALVPERS
jgi:ABC-type Mn2+/Zn2+ transport system permease subunit